MIIRDAQLQALKKMVGGELEKRLVDYIRTEYPSHKQVGSDQLLLLAQTAIRVARKHGFVSEVGIRAVLDGMIYFGIDFASDPQCRPIHGLLQDTKTDERRRIPRLHTSGARLWRQYAGESGQLWAHAIRSFWTLRQTGSMTLSPASLEQSAESFYIRKASILGKDIMAILHQRATASAAEQKLPPDDGPGVLIRFILLFGIAVTDDPRFTKIFASAADAATPRERVAILHSTAVRSFQAWIASHNDMKGGES